jgi:trehalose synthase
VERNDDAHLVLAGPAVTAVADDPEGALVLEECWAAWRQLSPRVRRRVTLACLPMDDLEENAAIVNALQRHATVVVQKSLAEGFGLTVSEAMYKSTPVVASAVGGIVDQIVDGESGVLLADPTDLDGLASRVVELLDDPARRDRIARGGQERAIEHFLPNRHLGQWLDLLAGLRPPG